MRLPGMNTYESAGADFDAARIYRYALHRMWGSGSLAESRTLLWIMLNPSTADEVVLDPTLRRCERFTRTWQYEGFEVANLFAYRATDPAMLWRDDLDGRDIVGPETDAYLRAAVSRADLIVVGWGRCPRAMSRIRAVQAILAEQALWCLGVNQDGSPRHPLYLAASTPLQPFSPA